MNEVNKLPYQSKQDFGYANYLLYMLQSFMKHIDTVNYLVHIQKGSTCKNSIHNFVLYRDFFNNVDTCLKSLCLIFNSLFIPSSYDVSKIFVNSIKKVLIYIISMCYV